MTHLKKMLITSLMIALGIVLPMAFHSIPNSGRILLPMHLPVLLCGMVCGLPYGLLCGIITPLLSSLLTGMPSAAFLPPMICELAIYGVVSSLLMSLLLVKNTYIKVYVSLIGAMLAGRIVYGILNALIFEAGNYSMEIWLVSAFVTALPGIIVQIIIIPVTFFALQRAKLLDIHFQH